VPQLFVEFELEQNQSAMFAISISGDTALEIPQKRIAGTAAVANGSGSDGGGG
jgi:hypothetical protein